MAAQMTIYFANCTEMPTNCLYPHKIDIVDEASAKECFSHDYVCCEFKKYYRSNANFIRSNCIAVDIDNDHSDNPENWITEEHISQKFTNITFAIHYSRNHMKIKGSKSARPRFHIIIATKDVKDAEACKSLKERLQRQLPFIDTHAVDTAHFFFGTKEPDVIYHPGAKTLEDFLDTEEADDSWADTLGSIPEGSRNSTLSHKAGILIKRLGDTDEAKKVFMEESEKCTPLLPDAELEKIWRNAQTFYKKVSSQENYILPEIYNFKPRLMPLDFSDVGQAEVLTQELGSSLVFTTETGYLNFNGVYWEESEERAQGKVHNLTSSQLDDADSYIQKALEFMNHTGASALLLGMSKQKAMSLFTPEQKASYQMFERAQNYKAFVIKRRDSKYVSATLKEARPMLLKSFRDLDANADDLNTPAGIYHLPDGLSGIRAHEAEALMTKVTSVAPNDTGMNLWKEALNLFFCGDVELIDYVQKIVGLAAIGKVYVEALIIAYGEGRNGKSTFWNTISKVLGTYSGNISADALTVGCRRNVKPELAEAKGKRLLIASELEEGMRLNTSIVKQLCSTDDIYGEKKYHSPGSFSPSHILVLFTNFLPKVGVSDPGTWRRLIVIPFKAKIEGNSDIKNYSDYIYENAGGAVLSWIIEGAKKVYDCNFQIEPPLCVQEAIKAYRDDNDWLNDFLYECCEIDDSYKEKSGDLYTEYRNHCAGTGEYTRSTSDFYTAIEHAGFERKRDKSGRYVLGLRIKPLFSA